MPPRALPRVVVVDDHDEALEAIHAAIRARRCPFAGLGLLHLDAHPDLSLPRGLPAGLLYAPSQLYAFLGASAGGISDWIVPLVAAGHIRTTWWLRPSWSHQIEVPLL